MYDGQHHSLTSVMKAGVLLLILLIGSNKIVSTHAYSISDEAAAKTALWEWLGKQPRHPAPFEKNWQPMLFIEDSEECGYQCTSIWARQYAANGLRITVMLHAKNYIVATSEALGDGVSIQGVRP